MNEEDFKNAEDENLDASNRKKKKSGSGETGGIYLTVAQQKGVLAEHQHHDSLAKVAARLAEFFGEGVACASAHAQVSFNVVAGAVGKGFTLITDLIKAGQDFASMVHDLSQENQLKIREKYNLILSGPSG